MKVVGVVVDEGDGEGAVGGADVGVDEDGDGKTEGVGGESLALVEGVGLEVAVEGAADLNVG